ncbi:hypothetical protein D3C85_717570 [compost metagenome]
MNVGQLKEFIKDLPDDMLLVGDDCISPFIEGMGIKARVDTVWNDKLMCEVEVLDIYTSC